MSDAIKNRYEFVLLFDVKDGNPNGDPDAGNLPRIDPETGNGLVTDVCLKRKVRNYVGLVNGERPPFEIYIKEKAILNRQHERAYDYLDESDSIRKLIPAEISDETIDAVIEIVGKNFLARKTIGEDASRYLVLNPRSPLTEMKKKCKSDKKNKLDETTVKYIKAFLEIAVDMEAQRWMCKNFFDVRTFGAVMSTGDWQCGQVRGPVQVGFARSVERIFTGEHTITRMAVTTEGDAEKQKGDNRTMGRKFTVPYGLYRVHGFISAPLAKQTGFSEKDLELFWNALLNMFDHDRSAARGEMAARKLVVFKHESELGNVSAQTLFDLVTIDRKMVRSRPARSFDDYKDAIVIDMAKKPAGVELLEKL